MQRDIVKRKPTGKHLFHKHNLTVSRRVVSVPSHSSGIIARSEAALGTLIFLLLVRSVCQIFTAHGSIKNVNRYMKAGPLQAGHMHIVYIVSTCVTVDQSFSYAAITVLPWFMFIERHLMDFKF